MKFTNNLTTSDLTLASTLVTLGFTPNRIDRAHGGRVDFVFLNSDALAKVVDGFWKRTVRVNPHEFANAQRYLKSRLHNP